MKTLNAWNLAAFAPRIVDIDCLPFVCTLGLGPTTMPCAARVCPQALRRRPQMMFMARRAPCEPNNL